MRYFTFCPLSIKNTVCKKILKIKLKKKTQCVFDTFGTSLFGLATFQGFRGQCPQVGHTWAG